MFFNGKSPNNLGYPDSLEIHYRTSYESKWYIFSTWLGEFKEDAELSEVSGIVKGPFDTE